MLLKKRYLSKIISLIFLIIFTIGGNYLFNYLKYDNKKIVEIATAKQEIEILHNELKNVQLIKELDHDYQIARVTLRDIHNFYNEIVINIGSNKVNVGDPVVNEQGLIGIISKVDKDQSYVKLLSNAINLSVKVDNTYGNLKGNKVDLLDKYSNLKVGDIITTSGLTNIPEGLYVGKITKVKMDENNLGQELEVELVDTNDLIYVGVLSSIK